MNKYSRRYECPHCGQKGRVNRKEAQLGRVQCVKCKKMSKASPLYVGDEGAKERDEATKNQENK